MDNLRARDVVCTEFKIRTRYFLDRSGLVQYQEEHISTSSEIFISVEITSGPLKHFTILASKFIPARPKIGGEGLPQNIFE